MAYPKASANLNAVVTKQGRFMPITTLITEAKKITPYDCPAAHEWLQDMLTTHHQLNDPVTAIRFFMLGLFASDAISLDAWHEFDALIAAKSSANIH